MFWRNVDRFQKRAEISRMEEVLLLKGIFSEKISNF